MIDSVKMDAKSKLKLKLAQKRASRTNNTKALLSDAVGDQPKDSPLAPMLAKITEFLVSMKKTKNGNADALAGLTSLMTEVFTGVQDEKEREVLTELVSGMIPVQGQSIFKKICDSALKTTKQAQPPSIPTTKEDDVTQQKKKKKNRRRRKKKAAPSSEEVIVVDPFLKAERPKLM